MKVEIIITEGRDYGVHHRMLVDGKDRLYVSPLYECPEDACIGRDLVDCVQVSNFMKEAHAAGLRGEPLEIILTKESPDA